MARKPFFVLISLMAVVSLACGISIPVQVKTGPTVTDEIHVPLTPGNSQAYSVTLSFGAGNFTLVPGAQNEVVSGSATYNVEDFKPKITTNQNVISVEQGNLKLGGIPNFQNKVRNDWSLQLGNVPMRLTVNAGAYTGRYELGGLPIQSLSVSDGAADVDLAFTSPNPGNMDTFNYTTGASSVKLSGLANAHFAKMTFRSGAGDYRLDFNGDLRFATDVTVESGLSNITIIVPVGVSAKVSFEGGLANVQASGKWVKNGSEYSQSGSGPTLTISVKLGAGNLNLQNP
jgi:hypothetical protein